MSDFVKFPYQKARRRLHFLEFYTQNNGTNSDLDAPRMTIESDGTVIIKEKLKLETVTSDASGYILRWNASDKIVYHSDSRLKNILETNLLTL